MAGEGSDNAAASATSRASADGARLTLAVGLIAVVLGGCGNGPLQPRGAFRLAPPVAGAPARMAVLATARGPAAPASTVTAHATCPAGTIVSGGGVSTTLIGGGTPPSSLHANGTAPTGPGEHPSSGGAPTGWVALGATGGQLVLGGATTVAAICLHESARPMVVVVGVPGPATAATTATATASCPPGAVLLGGGGYATVTRGEASPSLHLIGSYPSDARGSPLTDGSPTSGNWTARADAGGRTGAGVETVAFAICAQASHRATRVAVAGTPGPLPASSATTVTADCPARTLLIAGGARTGPAQGTPQQGLHLTGSFPSDPAGRAGWSAPRGTTVNAWSARAESGGQGSPGGTATTAFAVCMAS